MRLASLCNPPGGREPKPCWRLLPLSPSRPAAPTGRRYREDFQLAKDAGCNAFRLSIEWARIEPRRGYLDLDAVAR